MSCRYNRWCSVKVQRWCCWGWSTNFECVLQVTSGSQVSVWLSTRTPISCTNSLFAQCRLNPARKPFTAKRMRRAFKNWWLASKNALVCQTCRVRILTFEQFALSFWEWFVCIFQRSLLRIAAFIRFRFCQQFSQHVPEFVNPLEFIRIYCTFPARSRVSQHIPNFVNGPSYNSRSLLDFSRSAYFSSPFYFDCERPMKRVFSVSRSL